MTKQLAVFLLIPLALMACRRKTYSSSTSVPDPVYSQEYTPAPDNEYYAPAEQASTGNGSAPVQQVNYEPSPYADQSAQQAPDYYDHVEDQEFYDELQPYGDWVRDPDYGYVWIPNAGPDFRPYYSRGHWVYTNYGWTWASDYNWGWAAFHYGSWQFSPRWGWTWIPGRVWAPAWVTWGYYDNSYGWAPMGPYAPGGWNNYRPHRSHWCFVNPAYMNQTNWYRHQNNYPDVVINNVTIINNFNNNAGGNRPYNRGPQTKDVERYTKRPIRAVEVSNSSRPSRTEVSSNRITMYRPEVKNTGSTDKPSRPARVSNYEELKKENRLPAGSTPPTERPSRPNTTPANNNRPQQPVTRPSRPATDPARPTQPERQPAQPTTDPVKPSRPTTVPPTDNKPQQPETRPSRPQNEPVKTPPAKPETRPTQPSRPTTIPPKDQGNQGVNKATDKPAGSTPERAPVSKPDRPERTPAPATSKPQRNEQINKSEPAKPGKINERPSSNSKPRPNPSKDPDTRSKTLPKRGG